MSADDSITQFREFCDSHDCETCEYLRFKDRGERYACAIAWMEKNAVSANDEIGLKPCPFCGGEADGCADFQITSDGVVWCVISCTECQAKMMETAFNGDDMIRAFKDGDSWHFNLGDILRVRRAAAAAWNRRPEA